MAAKLVFAELVHNVTAVSALRRIGVWTRGEEGPRRAAWDGYGAALLEGADFDRLGRISQGYSALEDAAWLARDVETDFTKGDDAALLERLIQLVKDAVADVGVVAGLSEDEMARRLELIRDHEESAPS